MPLNENHRRALVSGFVAIDRTLREIEANIAAASTSPFATYAVDLSTVEQRTLLDYVGRAREQMVEALRSAGIGLTGSRSSIRGPIQTGMTFAGITVDELAPARLKGYGALDDASRVALERVLADLARTLRTLRAYVSRDASADVKNRLGRLDGAPIDVALVQTMDDVITRRGLVELRASLVSIVERLETRTFDIAVFGRVSSGKSSLLNAVIGVSVLPVGVTPVTAFPTRITWGEESNVVVSFADRDDGTVGLDRLAEYVTEQHNADNAKRVTRAIVRLRANVLRATVTFVDTPGVGSLARMGARETYAYLPTCDLGVVVIDGVSPPGAEDFGLLARLLDSGIAAKVVLSKADLVDEGHRAQMGAYVSEAIRRELGTAIEPVWVSNIGEMPSARAWFDREIEPLVVEGRALADESLRRKVERLRSHLVAALRGDGETVPPAPASDRARLDALGADAERLLEATERRVEETVSSVRELAPRLVRELAARIAGRADDESIAGAIDSVVASVADETRIALRGELASARDSLSRMLVEIASSVGETDVMADLRVDFLGMPTPTLPASLREFRFDARRWPAPLRAQRITSRLVDSGGAIVRMLSDFGIALRAWGRAALARLGEQFAAEADPLRARAHPVAPKAEIDASIADDLRALGAAGLTESRGPLT